MNQENKYQGHSDHDLLIEAHVKLDGLEKQFSNHLAHHWATTICVLGAMISGFVGLFISLILLL